ncbi:MAG: hypothetical protein OEN56_05495, partial [Gemmatimonadota bacterium]|nr:hypothetical protein [Gemmatimonadota bacterium]
MSIPSWTSVQEICLAALDLDEDSRTEYLDRVCDGDSALRAEVESLLAHHDPGFLEAPYVSVDQLDDPAEPSQMRRFGTYRVVRPIGRGGM